MRIFDIFIAELRARGVSLKMPSDPLRDGEFIHLLTNVFDPGLPAIMPPIYGLVAA